MYIDSMGTEVRKISRYTGRSERCYDIMKTSDECYLMAGWQDTDNDQVFVYKTRSNPLDISVPESDFIPHPSSLYLSAFPNPFNSAVTIEYFLDRPGLIDLTVCDLTGRHVASLVENQNETGRHRVVWDATRLSTGEYMVRLSTGDRNLTRPIILTK
jgi:hypothetical protein